VSDLTPSGFFILRTPLLPFTELAEWSRDVPIDPIDPAGSAGRGELRRRLAEVFQRAEVREALFLASPELEAQLGPWLVGELEPDGGRITSTLVRYFSRMTWRSTPFGLFAGCTSGATGEKTRLRLAPRAEYRRQTRFDTVFTFALAEALAAAPGAAGGLVYHPNPTLYPAADRLRYIEARPEGVRRIQALSVVRPDEYLEAVLAAAAAGATLEQLATAFQARFPDVEEPEVREYLDELVARRVIQPDLAPAVTGASPPFVSLLAAARATGVLTAEVGLMDSLQKEIEGFDRQGLGAPPDAYRRLADQAGALPARPDLAHLVHVDLFKPAAEARLGRAVLDELQRGVALLHRLTPHSLYRSERLAEFVRDFQRLYGEREVPLSLALDDELGAGYGFTRQRNAGAVPLLKDLAFPSRDEGHGRPWTRRERALLEILFQARERGDREILLRPEDLELLAVEEEPLPLPKAFVAFARLAAGSAEDLDRGDFTLCLISASGPSGAHQMGRFCHGDEDLRRWVLGHLEAEEAARPDAVFAEVVYMPENLQHGNVVLRPCLRRYEIPYCAVSGAPAEGQIPVSEILVSVRDGEVRLRWARNGAEILPRQSNAYAFNRLGGGLYRFLCDLQNQGVAGALRWEWGPLWQTSFLPRIRHGRTVLSRARWRLAETEVRALRDARRSPSALAAAVRSLRAGRGLPRFLALQEDDQEMPVDLENPLSVEMLAGLLREGEAAGLVELFPPPESLVVAGPEGSFAHEMVVPFLTRTPPERARAFDLPVDAAFPRAFPPGSEWLYAAFFTAPSAIDSLLLEPLAGLLQNLASGGAVDRWFFVRYESPDWHLRLRLHGDPERLRREVLPPLQAVARSLLDSGLIQRFQLDTYEREVERYGGPEGVRLAEEVFHADSEAALRILELLGGDGATPARWQLTLAGIDHLLIALGFDLPARHFVMAELRRSYTGEFKAGPLLKRQLGARYRELKTSLTRLLGPEAAPPAVIAAGERIFRACYEPLAGCGERLRELEREGKLSRRPAQIAASYVHLQVNRLLRSAQREQELVLYEFLYRFYGELRGRGTDSRAALARAR
jgi:thiopeptide-type bacteriocin biosynthesis protein